MKDQIVFNISIGLFLLFVATISDFGSLPVRLHFEQDFEACDGLEQLIAYNSRSALGIDIWTVRPSDSSLTNLTKGISNNLTPSWSSDGERLAFATDRDGNWEVYVTDTNGNNLTNLSNDPADDQYPKWSPDGTKIAFVSNRAGNQDIYVMNVDGTNAIKISNDSTDNILPVWAPDSEAIAYTTNKDNIREIVISNLKHGTTVNFQNASHASFMSWSPQGNFISFSSDMSGNSEIYVLDIERRLIGNLTNNFDTNLQPYWSPDGEFILFWAVNSETFEVSIYVIDTVDGIVRNLSINSTRDSGGIWSPDGKHIAYYSGRDGVSLYITDIDGNDTRMMAPQIQDSSLAWQPCSATNGS